MKYVVFIILFVFPPPLFAQALFGYVEDAETGERLIGASIRVVASQTGGLTNAHGYWHIRMLHKTLVKISISYVGYRDTSFSANPSLQEALIVRLAPQNDIKPVVEVEAPSEAWASTGIDAVRLQIEDIKRQPTVLGEKDVLKALQRIPGVQGGTEGSSQLIVRGGSPDQNLILLDGTPVYNANHIFGFLSVFNTDALQHVELVKGGFPARYGGRLSSVLDIQMKEGNMRKFEAHATLGLLTSQTTIEGPVLKNKMSFMVSGRATYLDKLLSLYLRLNPDQGIGFYKVGFHDLNVKINYIFSNKVRLFYSFYTGKDIYAANTREDFPIVDTKFKATFEKFIARLGWQSMTHSLRWHYIVRPYLFINANVIASQFRFNTFNQRTVGNINTNGTDLVSHDFQLSYISDIRDFGAKVDADYLKYPKHQIKIGAGLTQHLFTPQVYKVSSLDQGNQDHKITIKSAEGYLYAEDTLPLTNHLKANIGLRIAGNYVQEKLYAAIEPRILIQYMKNTTKNVGISLSRTYQYIHLLSNLGLGLPSDLWVPATARIRPQEAWQTSLGGSFRLSRHISLKSEVFYKWMSHVLSYKEGASLAGSNLKWEDQLTQGKGRAYGWETWLQMQKEIMKISMAYTWLRSTRQFQGLNDGLVFPDRYDRRHTVYVDAHYRLNKKINLTASWVYQSGIAVTVANQFVALIDENASGFAGPYFDSINNYRFRPLHRLDLGFGFDLSKKSRKRNIELGVYNAYNRKNPTFITPTSGYRLKSTSLLPVLPIINYNFSI